MRSYAVAVDETAKSLELGMKNKEPCTLQITSSTVILVLESSVPISWPFNCIRRYKCHPGSFLLEVGRKAPTGEGVFCFFTQEGQEIFEVLGKTVANRMSSKQEQSKPDVINASAATSNQTSDNHSFPIPAAIAGKQNPFLDFTGGGGGVGGGEGVRFVMKRRTSSPPPIPTESPRSPHHTESEGGSYNHLRLKNEKPLTEDEEGDYDQLARAKECSKFNKTRLSERNQPNGSSSKALKLLGLLRSNSVENVRAPERGNEESQCDLYSHLEFDKHNLKKTQSASNVIESESGNFSAYNHIKSEPNQHQSGDIYNRLNSDMKKKIEAIQSENAYNVLGDVGNADEPSTTADGTYDKLGARIVSASHRHARPEPIIITDDSYNAIDFSKERGDPISSNNAKQSRCPVNPYEEPAILQRPFPERITQVNYDNVPAHENRPAMVKPVPLHGAKPVVHKKPVPVKPPRAVGVGVTPAGEDNLSESGKDVGSSRTKVGGGDVRENLISQLKKNFEIHDQASPKSPSTPFSPRSSSKKLVEPFYAVSPFGSGNTPTQTAPSEYDVPSNNAPKVEQPTSEHKQQQQQQQQIGFLYAVSPFHSGNQKQAPNLDQNLYDTPSHQNRPPAVSNALNTYDVPVQRPVRNAMENVYDTPKQQNLIRVPQSQESIRERFQASDRNVQFTYAVSPFAGAQNSANQIRFHENGSAQARNTQEEAAYCEVPEVMPGYRSVDGYDPVGGILHSGRRSNEPLYADPRD